MRRDDRQESPLGLPRGLSVVVPVYNGERSLPELIKQLQPVLQASSRNGKEAFEVILVNDGSHDDSWNVISELVRRFEWVRGVDLMRNYGQHNALLCGIRAARYDVVVTMDDDLQHPPAEVPKLVAKLEEGYDVVYGIPEKLPHTPVRNVLSKITKIALAWAIGNPNIRELNAFRVFRTELRRGFSAYLSPVLLLDVLLGWTTVRFASVRVQQTRREVGLSNYTPLKLFNQFLIVLTGYTTAPLRAASLIGFGFVFVGVGLLSYVLIGYFMRGSVPGFTFTASLIAIFGGVQFFCLGIIGEYLARIFNRTNDRPTYVVRQTALHSPPAVQDNVDD